MKNSILFILLLYFLAFFSCKQELINETQIGKWKVFWEDVEGNFISIDTFEMILHPEHTITIKNSFALQFISNLYWTTSINESEIKLYINDTEKNVTFEFRHLSITTNEQNHQIWKYEDKSIGPEFPIYTILQLTRIE